MSRLHSAAPLHKPAYLAHPMVHAFVAYLAQLLEGERFEHAFNVRDKRLPSDHACRASGGRLQIASLEDAFKAYWWNGAGFVQNKAQLDDIRQRLLQAIAAEPSPDGASACLAAIDAVLAWGAGGTGQPLYTHNKRWAEARRADIVARMAQGRQVMTSATPDARLFGAPEGPRMNAGFTKYFSLACDDVVIYDGRVGAALGLLVKRFCRAHGQLAEVPQALGFRWGAQNPGRRAPELALHRDPSEPPYRFRALPSSGGPVWAEWNIKANWVLKAAQLRAQNAHWCQGEDGLRCIEAALFTLGYALPRP